MRVHEFTLRSDFGREHLIDISNRSAQFMSDIKIVFHHLDVEHHVDVKSLLGMILLPIRSGATIRLLTQGKDEEEAMEYIFQMFEPDREVRAID